MSIVGALIRLSPDMPRGSGQGQFPASGLLTMSAADGGTLRVAGTVKIDGTPAVPVRRRVRLFDVATGRPVRQVWSGADGTFLFDKVLTRTYNAVVADRVSAVP